MTTIVFLNLADMNKNGLAKTTVDALKIKYPRYRFVYELFAGANQIHLIDLFGFLKDEAEPKSGVLLPMLLPSQPVLWTQKLREQLEISILCGRADKIMLGVHGHYNDTANGFAGMGWEEEDGPIGNYRDFAQLLLKFLSRDATKKYRLSLIICYAARSENYKLDHDGALLATEIKSSFAYKFFSEICTHINVTMTARTGSVGFNSQTGRSVVQTEAAVQAEIEWEEFVKSDATQAVTDDHERLVQSMLTTPENRTAFREMSNRVEQPDYVPVTEQETTIRAFNNMKSTFNTLKNAAGEEKSKYGVFVYTYEEGQVKIYRKYQNGEKLMQRLYSAPL
jgi:hypothetical protein